MKIFRNLDFSIKHPCLMALGTFDGIHVAHRKLLRYSRRLAGSEGLKFIVFSFSNLPRNLFLKTSLKKIMDQSQKEAEFRKLGVDYLIHLEFTREFSMLTAHEFIEFLLKRCRIKYLCAGFNFKFGHLNRGDAAFLERMGEKLGIEARVIPPVEKNGQIVSSSLVREKLSQGKIDEALHFLGHPFLIRGRVVHGRGCGSRFGFPTANLVPDKELIVPKHGVYFCYAVLSDGRILPGLINIGSVPSFFNDSGHRFELHILDFNENLYRKQLTAVPVHYLRPELKLSVPELIIAITRDIESARNFFAQRGDHEKILRFLSDA